jgi:2-polyprenyl-3-methyl-5-hydroxy-6-metoxy-1,4-benzoquinol methylase
VSLQGVGDSCPVDGLLELLLRGAPVRKPVPDERGSSPHADLHAIEVNTERQDAMTDNEIREAMARYKFYHVIQLTEGIATPGNPDFVPMQDLCMKHLRSLDLKGKRVLDIGCRDGLFSFAAESMGAAEVIGIDNDLSRPATEFLIPFFNSKIQMKQMNLYDLKPDSFGVFDVIILAGVLYHLRYPFWALRIIRDISKVGGDLLIETGVWVGEPHNPMLFCPVGDEGPYNDPTSCTFFNEKGLVDTLKSFGFSMVSAEYLGQEVKEKAPVSVGRWSRIKNCIKECLSDANPVENQPPMVTNRGGFHFRFHGHRQDSFVSTYWEATHDCHTLYGGIPTNPDEQ